MSTQRQRKSKSQRIASATQRALKPQRRRKTRETYALNAAKMIDAAFARKVPVTIGDQAIEMSTFRAIVLQLAIKAATNKRALRVLSRYQAYAAKRRGFEEPLIIFERPRKPKP